MTPAELDEIRERVERVKPYKVEYIPGGTNPSDLGGSWDWTLVEQLLKQDIPKLLSHISKQDEELKRLREIEQAARRMMKHVTVIEKSSERKVE